MKSVTANEPHENLNFSLLHLSSRTLLGNSDRFKALIANMNSAFSVISFSETWLSDETFIQVDLQGYNYISNHRTNEIGGGVGLNQQDHFQHKKIKNCIISNPDVTESLFVEVVNPNGKNTLEQERFAVHKIKTFHLSLRNLI